jgi:hypothetical protein
MTTYDPMRRLFGFLVTQYMTMRKISREEAEGEHSYQLGRYHGLLEAYSVVTGMSSATVESDVLDHAARQEEHSENGT